MYVPKQFEEQRIDVMHELIRAHPLATIVTSSADGLNANHIPVQLLGSSEPFGVLRGHVARSNPMLADLVNGTESLAIFNGPNAYITPSWYATKQEAGKVVPTWNYAVVHAYGLMRVMDDPGWLRAQLEALTNHNEASLPEPWAVSDAPNEYIEQTMSVIVGVEMIITKLVGKWKISQNQPTQNKIGVVAGLSASNVPDAAAMAALIAAGSKVSA